MNTAPRKAGRPKLETPPMDQNLFIKPCGYCGNEFRKPVVEPWNRWFVRKYCSLSCYHMKRKGAVI